MQGRGLIFLAIVSFALTLRMGVTSFTPLLGELQRQFGFSTAMMGVFGTAPVLMFGLAGFFTPLLVHRLGVERLALASTVCTFIGLLGRGFADTSWGEFGWYCLALAGMGVGNVVTPALVKRYFSDSITQVSTWYTLAVQLGAVIPPVLAVWMQQKEGWRFSLESWAVVPLLVIPLLVVVVLRSGGRTEVEGAARRVPLRAFARSRIAWGMAVLFGVTSLNSYSMMTWLPKRLVAVGFSIDKGALMLAFYSLVGMLAGLIVVPLLGRISNPFVFVLLAGLCHIAGFAGLLWAPTSGTVLWVVLVGIGPVTFAMNLTFIGLRTRSSEYAAALSGFAQGLGYLIAIAGPVLFGVFYEWTGGWAASFVFLACVTVVGVVGGWFVCRGGYVEDELAVRPPA